jgi:SAM-dependent methyltransferase
MPRASPETGSRRSRSPSLRGKAGGAILEVDGGSSEPALAATVFFSSYEQWAEAEREALKEVRGRILDIGCGAGRHALYFQERGHEVVAVDISLGAAEVARARGVRDVRVLAAEEIDETLGSFDSLLMMCGNFGLVGSAEGGRRLLERLGRVTSPGGVLVADCLEGGHIRLRLQYLDRVTPWFERLNPSPRELAEIAQPTGWDVERVIHYEEEPEAYAAILRHRA